MHMFLLGTFYWTINCKQKWKNQLLTKNGAINCMFEYFKQLFLYVYYKGKLIFPHINKAHGRQRSDPQICYFANFCVISVLE